MNMTKNMTKVKIDGDNVVSTIGEGIFGTFVEHLGRSVYTGIYQPDHVTADEDGFRGDVIALTRKLRFSHIRWPGGNFVSGYDWKDAIGPKNERRARPDLAWAQIEPNEVGTAEFAKFCKKVGSEVMMAANLGTGTPRDAAELLEYCNFEKGTYYSDLRRRHGYESPFGIRRWCIGNEMDGPWQICMQTADEYGRKALETAKMMKWLDPTIELVATGSSGWLMPSCPEWDRKILEYTYSHVDYISLHRYYFCEDKNDRKKFNDFLCSSADMDRYIRAIVSTADYVKALKRGKKDIMLSFDEYNVWEDKAADDHDLWTVGPRRQENIYDHADALVLASMMMTFIEHSDRVKLACLAQLINALGMIFTEPGREGRSCLQTIAYPFLILRNCGGEKLLYQRTSGPLLQSEQYGEVSAVKTLASYNEESGQIRVFALNLTAEKAQVNLNISAFSKLRLVEKSEYIGNLKDKNVCGAEPCGIVRTAENSVFEDGNGVVAVSPYSLTMFVFSVL